MRIFVEIESNKTEGLHFDWKESDSYFPCYGVAMSLVLNLVNFHSVGISNPILLSQNITPQFLMCSISTNILMILVNLPGS